VGYLTYATDPANMLFNLNWPEFPEPTGVDGLATTLGLNSLSTLRSPTSFTFPLTRFGAHFVSRR
jgi:hypothetical protein